MYTLYFSPNACSLATHTLLNLLGHPPELVNVADVDQFADINPYQMVPVLQDGDQTLTEGAAIMFYLLDKHDNALMPPEGAQRQRALQNLMMANASMHPAYGRLFFAEAKIPDGEAKNAVFVSAAEAINKLWHIVENSFTEGPYLGGESLSPADILLTVYSRWGQYFDVDIHIGPKTQNMIARVSETTAFKEALARESGNGHG